MEKKVIVGTYVNGRLQPPVQGGDAAIEDGQTKKIEGKTAELKITTNYEPIYDTRYDLNQLVAFLGAALYLASPDDEDPAKADIITALCCLQEKLAECAEALDGAWKEGILREEKSAPAAVSAAAGA